MAGEVTYKTKQGDTWDQIAARELGNATLGAELAGFNGYAAHMACPAGIEITIPYRKAPKDEPKGKPGKSSSDAKGASTEPTS